MNKPLFEVGEEVIAQFKYYPQNNGEYVIIEILTPEQFSKEFPEFLNNSRIYYRLEGLKIVGDKSLKYTTDCASESALRKKHKPSEMSFDGLMDFLKSPVKTA